LEKLEVLVHKLNDTVSNQLKHADNLDTALVEIKKDIELKFENFTE
jgi:hypothetical protein